MMKKHRDIILKDAKSASEDPFDWAIGLRVFVDHLYFMRDYYELGENVVALDEEGKPTRWQYLNLILAEYEEWVTCEDKYFKVIFKDDKEAEEKLQKLLKQGYYLKEQNDASPSIFNHCYFLYKNKDWHENITLNNKEYDLHRKKFFELLGEYLEYISD